MVVQPARKSTDKKRSHVCGLQGFNPHAGDDCAACHHNSVTFTSTDSPKTCVNCGCVTYGHRMICCDDPREDDDDVITHCLNDLWDDQTKFMKLLQKERNFPAFPVDMSSKSGQKLIKDIAHDCMHELFEALVTLKNSKNHRKTLVESFDRQNFVEELVDTQKFLLEILILAGVSIDEFCDRFFEKSKVNIDRITGDY